MKWRYHPLWVPSLVMAFLQPVRKLPYIFGVLFGPPGQNFHCPDYFGKYEVKIRIFLALKEKGYRSEFVFKVEGAYVQGLSYHTLEHFTYAPNGKLLNDRALNYEVCLAKDIPVDFRVKLRFNSKNSKGVLGSKSEFR